MFCLDSESVLFCFFVDFTSSVEHSHVVGHHIGQPLLWLKVVISEKNIAL